MFLLCAVPYCFIKFFDYIYIIIKYFNKIFFILILFISCYGTTCYANNIIKIKKDNIKEIQEMFKKTAKYYKDENNNYYTDHFLNEGINKNVQRIFGKPKTKLDNQEIMEIVKDNIYKNEGLRLKAYHLKGEYYYLNNKKNKLYTICLGNTTIKDDDGKIKRYINENDNFTIYQCNELFKHQFDHYNKLLYTAMTDNKGDNYYNLLTNFEIASMVELVFWMGKQGSIYITSAMINYVKFHRTKDGYKRVLKAFKKYGKKCQKQYQKGCKIRQQKIINTLNGFMQKN